VTRGVVERLVAPTLARAATAGAGLDWKTSLQEAAAEGGLGAPVYDVTGEGPPHARVFTARVAVGGRVLGEGRGTAKKHAEQDAARSAVAALLEDDGGDDAPDADRRA
jgi:ribonuclease III